MLRRRLGSPVFVATHAGWSGHVRTSYDAASPAATHAHTRHTEQSFTPSLYDGREQVGDPWPVFLSPFFPRCLPDRSFYIMISATDLKAVM